MPPKQELVRSWLTKAGNDLIMAERALAGEGAIVDAACFHAQQAVEKALKAVLVLREIEPPRTHHIGVLLKRCGRIDERLTGMSEKLRWLTSFAVDVRYADMGEEPTLEQAREVVSLARRAVEVITENVPKETCP